MITITNSEEDSLSFRIEGETEDKIIDGIEPTFETIEVIHGDRVVGEQLVTEYPNQWNEEEQINYIKNNIHLAEVEPE